MALVDSPSYSHSHYDSIHSSRRPSWHSCFHDHNSALSTHERPRGFDIVQLDSALDGLHIDGIDALATLENVNTSGPPRPDDASSLEASPHASTADQFENPGLDSEEDQTSTKVPWQKWIRSLRRKANQRPGVRTMAQGLFEPGKGDEIPTSRRTGHLKSSSGSSFRFVTAVRSASVSLASASVAARSKRTTARSHSHLRTDRSSRASMSGPRISEDSLQADVSLLADAVSLERSLQRRRILEELIRTEESYISDVRFLTHVYITILAALPTLPVRLRSSINRNLNEIIELHEELLGDLHRVVPHSEYTQIDIPTALTSLPKQPLHKRPGHRRGISLDAVPEHYKRASRLQDVPSMLSDPQTAAQVARVFSKKMSRFFIYKEYGAKYELMIKDIASAHRTMPEWETYQKGLETLATTLGSTKSSGSKFKQSLTLGDLLVKPIQRVCKYPLLFAELLRYTTVSDCPNSHMEVDDTLMRLREATAEINRATDDPQIKATLEKTWLLQDRLIFPHRKLDAASKNRVRSFGFISLCGALHVCWQSPQNVEGQYFICLMYRDVLCLATAGKVDPIYTIHACIRLSSMRVEDADNGRGLQCHTAPFSWKMVFEVDHQLHEMIMTACGPKEEAEWRSRLTRCSTKEADFGRPDLYTCLDLDIKSLGAIFGTRDSMARRISIQRALTVGPKAPLCQVVLKNTSVGSSTVSTASQTINRSQSLLASNSRVPVLAPSRAERARLEALLTDVWSREHLPFPGMTARARSEHLVRTSASSVMRKLSVASIASSFNKRPTNVGQRTRTIDPGPYGLQRTYSYGDDASITSAGVSAGGTENGTRGSLAMTPVDTPLVFGGRMMGEVKSAAEPSTELPGFKLTEVNRGTHSLKLSLTSDERGSSRPSLRTASVNSLQLTASSRSEKSQPHSVEKENRGQSPLPGRIGAQGRWPRPGLHRGESRVQSFRNLFR